jgi:hypothetical protein
LSFRQWDVPATVSGIPLEDRLAAADDALDETAPCRRKQKP